MHRRHAYRRYNLVARRRSAKVAGKVFRIGHLGDLNELMVLGALAGAEMSMLDNGVKIRRAPASARRRSTCATT